MCLFGHAWARLLKSLPMLPSLITNYVRSCLKWIKCTDNFVALGRELPLECCAILGRGIALPCSKFHTFLHFQSDPRYYCRPGWVNILAKYTAKLKLSRSITRNDVIFLKFQWGLSIQNSGESRGKNPAFFPTRNYSGRETSEEAGETKILKKRMWKLQVGVKNWKKCA